MTEGPVTSPASAAPHDTPASADRLELKVWLRLLTCTTLIEKEIRANLRGEFDMTLPRFDFLAQLERAPEGLSMGELSSRLMVSNGNVTGLADRLVQEGLVRRDPSPTDRRSQHVALTDKGRAVFRTMTPAHAAWVQDAMEGLSRDDLGHLYSILEKLKDKLRA